ncbi:HepT-like ribonuclease domain-containing protein [Proteiniphilum sp.]|uniref:HepT-like ribonuclease domain-containing protein n=1 Tax=Proteiniphilum sp. TaxID=1926877 RepID=UPI00332BB7C4
MSYNKELAIHILKQIEKAILLIQDRTLEIHSASDFLTKPRNVEKLDAVCMQFITIGESLKGLDKVTNKELLSTDPNIPWSKIMGLRDFIAHHYFDVDADEIWWIIENELNPLFNAIQTFINILSNPNNK